MKKKILWKILIFTMFIIGTNVTISKAAISATSKTVNSGENFSVSVSSNVPVGSYRITMTNTNGIKFVSSSGGTASADGTRITGAAQNSNSGITNLATYTFKAPEVSKDTTYSISFFADAMEDMNLNPISNVSATSTITVKAATSGNSGNSGSSSNNTASSNAKLSNLGITPKQFDFDGFKPWIKEYRATVPNNITSVQVYANGTKYSVSGPYNNLQVGTNKILVTVTETGEKYTIYVARQAGKDDEVTPNVIDEGNQEGENDEQTGTENPEENPEQEELGLLSIAIDEEYEIYLNPEFKTDIYEYTIELKEDLTEIPLKAIANRENAKIEITGNEDLKEGENVITITVTDEETEEKVEYKITVKKVMAMQEEKEQNNDKKNEETKWLIVAVATGAIAVIVIIVVSCILIKRRRKFENEFGVEYDEEQYENDYFEHNEVNTDDSIKEDMQPVNDKPKLDEVFGKSYVEEYEDEMPKNKKRRKGKHF